MKFLYLKKIIADMKSFFTYSQKTVLLIVLFFISLYLISNGSHPFIGCAKEEVITKKDTAVAWKYPSLSSISDNEEGKMIKFGRRIFIETFRFIGPDVKDTNMRFAGNNMDCQNCHFNAGTQQYVFGLVGVYSKYPSLDARENKVISIQQRVNQCITRSMNGKAMPETSNEMNALVAYLKWLSTDIPKGKTVEGQGLPLIPLLNRAADTAAGRKIFDDKCITCHAYSGVGALNKPGNVKVPADSLKGYDLPPVFGDESYNDGAGMYRELTAAAFIFAKMPLSSATLSIEDSYDVAAFINSQKRPEKKDLDKDYPDLKLKPVDAPFPPYADSFPSSQHKYGPYQEMIQLKEPSKMIDPSTALHK